MAHNGIRCSRCMKEWVRLVGRAHRDNEPTELFECPACGKQVEFAVEPQVPAVRRAGDMTQWPLAQPSPALGHAGRLAVTGRVARSTGGLWNPLRVPG
jgi:DNA-directed RNA polymerase subunit RPC12/RpoP